MKILIAEDEVAMQKILKLYLEKENYVVDIACDGEEAITLACKDYFDLILLDWMLPKCQGIDVCSQLRTLGIKSKILMLTARGEIEDEFNGLSCGADDYVRKPFDPSILLLRIKKLLNCDDRITCGDLEFNRHTGEIRLGSETLTLTKKEFNLLYLFLVNQGTALLRDVIIERVWGMDYTGDERTLDTHIRRLRGKIGDGYIQTLVGVGYRMANTHE